jgi:hypothetical protein
MITRTVIGCLFHCLMAGAWRGSVEAPGPVAPRAQRIHGDADEHVEGAGGFGGVVHQGYELGDVDLSQVGAQIITDALAPDDPNVVSHLQRQRRVDGHVQLARPADLWHVSAFRGAPG